MRRGRRRNTWGVRNSGCCHNSGEEGDAGEELHGEYGGDDLNE
jgi:hypothetical protein